MNTITWIEIKKSALLHNVQQYKKWLPVHTKIAPVIKANAYGHGLTQIGILHDQNPDIARLCVANTQEAVTLRKAGIIKPILNIGFINTSHEEIIQHDIDMVVYDQETIKQLNALGQRFSKKINVHLKIDTGLSRLGIVPQEFTLYQHLIAQSPFLHLQGICSHLFEASNKELVHQQEDILQPFFRPDIEFHTSNSHGSLHSKYHYSFVRIGAGLYGYLPEANATLQSMLQPVLSLKTKVVGLKNVAAGTNVGYARTYVTNKPSKLAILGMGYYEGINPNLSNRGKVLLHGHFAPIVGRINMNYCTVDVTDIRNVQMHDTATILGRDSNNNITGYDWCTPEFKNVRVFLTQLNSNIPKKIVD